VALSAPVRAPRAEYTDTPLRAPRAGYTGTPLREVRKKMDVTVNVERPPRSQTLNEARALLDSIGYSARWLMSPNSSLVVARAASNLLCGLGVATIEGSTAVLMSFAVHPDFRGLRVGSRMVDGMLSHLRLSGAETAYLFSKVAGGFWERMGFSRTPIEEVAAKAPDHFQVREFIADGSIWTDKAFGRDLSSEN
jgi:N-acetylglutamate synthase-like GNAT family acetyltransferase